MEKDHLHILLADDDESDRLLFTEAFAELKIKTIVSIVKDGIELMETLNSENAPLPHLLFLDLNMPRKNGLECLKEIRSNKNLRDISIAIYSTSHNQKDMDETFHNGAHVYITKPDNFNELKIVLEKAVTMAFQYEDQSMIRENFLLRI